jgi:hypothetical protein
MVIPQRISKTQTICTQPMSGTVTTRKRWVTLGTVQSEEWSTNYIEFFHIRTSFIVGYFYFNDRTTNTNYWSERK